MSKKLNEEALRSELSDGSAFFTAAAEQDKTNLDTEAPPPAHDDVSGLNRRTYHDTVTPRHRDTRHPSIDDGLIETIRRSVNHFGKEDATYRFSTEEKKALADIVYTYAVAGVKTSQNQIARIAINNLLEDYRENGEASVLARVLERLNA
jgi:hypothetical protein